MRTLKNCTLTHLIENMALTDKQKIKIRELDMETKIQMLHECEDEFMSVDEYHKVEGINKRTIYDRIERGKIKNFTFCGQILIYK